MIAINLFIVIILLLQILVVSVLILLICYRLYSYLPIPIFVFLIINVYFFHLIYKKCRRYIIKNPNIVKHNVFIDLFEKCDDVWIINFKCLNGFFTDTTGLLKFDLNGFLFKKSFIRAYVVRNLRYKTISKKQKCFKLFNIKLNSDYLKPRLIYLKIDNKTILIYKNNKTINSVLSSQISLSMFTRHHTSIKAYISNNDVRKINERIYLEENKNYIFRKWYL